MAEDLNAKPWGTFRDFLTWRDWMWAFATGCMTVVTAEAFLRQGGWANALRFLFFVSFAIRSFVTFRRRIRILTDIAEPHGA